MHTSFYRKLFFLFLLLSICISQEYLCVRQDPMWSESRTRSWSAFWEPSFVSARSAYTEYPSLIKESYPFVKNSCSEESSKIFAFLRLFLTPVIGFFWLFKGFCLFSSRSFRIHAFLLQKAKKKRAPPKNFFRSYYNCKIAETS